VVAAEPVLAAGALRDDGEDVEGVDVEEEESELPLVVE
jgi:hypothetical protein